MFEFFELKLFANVPQLCLLYFFYGLAFVFLGISIAVKDMKGSELKLAGSLWLLAGFGFSHGAHEWLELYLILQGQYISTNEILLVRLATMLVVVLSFLFLLQFGLTLVRSINNRRKWLNWITPALTLFWVIYLWISYGFSMDIQFFERADILSRSTFGISGGLITAYGLVTYSRELKNLSLSISKNLLYAGVAFAFYSIFAGVVPSFSVLPYFPVRIEMLRAMSAVLIACFIIKALNISDLETRKKLEQQLKNLAQTDKMASLGRFAAGIAHEINNPLTNASLNAQTLRTKLEGCCGSDDILKKVDAIGRNVDKASIIARELLQFSRNTETEMKPVNINAIIQGAITLLQYKFKDITVHRTLSDMSYVMGDPVKLEQVFVNILDNSIQAMPEGTGDIRIESSHNEGWVKVKIADSGMGISAENIPKAFDPFFSTKDIGVGTGLGLSICYGIVSQHNGSIDIESTEGEGTMVTIILPAADKGA